MVKILAKIGVFSAIVGTIIGIFFQAPIFWIIGCSIAWIIVYAILFTTSISTGRWARGSKKGD